METGYFIFYHSTLFYLMQQNLLQGCKKLLVLHLLGLNLPFFFSFQNLKKRLSSYKWKSVKNVDTEQLIFYLKSFSVSMENPQHKHTLTLNNIEYILGYSALKKKKIIQREAWQWYPTQFSCSSPWGVGSEVSHLQTLRWGLSPRWPRRRWYFHQPFSQPQLGPSHSTLLSASLPLSPLQNISQISPNRPIPMHFNHHQGNLYRWSYNGRELITGVFTWSATRAQL